MSYTAQSQYTNPPYTPISTSGYWWKLPTAFSHISLPAGCDTATAFHPLQSRRMGAFFTDTCDMVSYVWMGYWKPVGSGSGGGTQRPVYATNGLTAANDSTVRLGGTLEDTTQIHVPLNSRFEMLANGASSFADINDGQKNPWFFLSSNDTLTTYSYGSIGASLMARQTTHFLGNDFRYLKGHEFTSIFTNADSTRLRSMGGDFNYTLRSAQIYTRNAVNNSRRVFFNSSTDFEAIPNILAWTYVNRPPLHTQPIRLRGIYSGVTSYPIIQSADTMDRWIGFASFSQLSTDARILKYYDFYSAGGGYGDARVDSAWSFFSNRTANRAYHAGPFALGGGNTGPTEQFELSGNFKHYSLRSGNDANDSMVVWNPTSQLYGKRPIPSAGSSQNLANTDLTQTAARVFDHDGNSLYWENGGETRWYGSGSYVGERMMVVVGSSGQWYGGRVSANTYFHASDSLRAVGLGVSNDTTAHKLVTVNPSSGALTYSNWPTAGGDVEDFPTEIKAYRDMGGSAVAETLGLPLIMANRSIALMDGQIRWIPVRVDKTCTITRVKLFFRTQGSFTGDNNNKVGLYTLSGTTLTQVAVTANDDNIFKAATNSYGDATFVTPYNASPGIYWVAVLWNASSTTTAPAIAAATNDLGNVAMGNIGFHPDIKMHGFISSQSDLPSTQAMSGISASSTPFYVILEDFVP